MTFKPWSKPRKELTKCGPSTLPFYSFFTKGLLVTSHSEEQRTWNHAAYL